MTRELDMTDFPAEAAAARYQAFALGRLRRGAARRPMGLFAAVSTAALASILVPLTGAVALSPAGQRTQEQRLTPAAEERMPASEIDVACSGQSWGNETTKCLVAISKDGGKTISARIRTISGA
ncbi:hypothetical protein [Aquibium oceanicum]|nr:hypothetical protein [Aquibium oceanicum]